MLSIKMLNVYLELLHSYSSSKDFSFLQGKGEFLQICLHIHVYNSGDFSFDWDLSEFFLHLPQTDCLIFLIVCRADWVLCVHTDLYLCCYFIHSVIPYLSFLKCQLSCLLWWKQKCGISLCLQIIVSLLDPSTLYTKKYIIFISILVNAEDSFVN